MRRHLLWFAALTTLSAFLPGCASVSKSPEPAPESVAEPASTQLEVARRALILGELSSANTTLSAVLAETPRDATALFLGACAALEAGDFDRARSLAERLSEVDHPAEAQMLVSMAGARQQGVGWLDALARAWSEAGRPSLRNSELLALESYDGALDLPLEALAAQAVSADDRALLALVANASWSRKVAMEALPDVSNPGIAQAVLVGLADGASTENLAALRASAVSVSRRHPESMQLALTAVLLGRSMDDRLTRDELAAIERASYLPLARTDHLVSHHARALRLFSRAGFPLPSFVAFDSTVGGLGSLASAVLGEKQGADLSPADRARLGEAIWRIGVAFARLPTLVEILLGNALAKRGATMVNDSKRREAAIQANEEMRALLGDLNQLELFHWPLHSLQNAFVTAAVENELDLVRRLSGAHGGANDTAPAEPPDGDPKSPSVQPAP